MLLQFSLSNWSLFKEDVALSMYGTRERQHGETLATVAKHRIRVLPVAAIFGPNSSGKSSLVEALAVAQMLIISGVDSDEPLPMIPYQLAESSKKEPTAMTFELLLGDDIFTYELVISKSVIIEEHLSRTNSTQTHKLFSRHEQFFTISPSLPDQDLIGLITRATRPNQLLLSSAARNNYLHLGPVRDWFRTQLVIIGPNPQLTIFDELFDDNDPKHHLGCELLDKLDTGIKSLTGVDVGFEVIGLTKRDAERQITAGQSLHVRHPGGKQKFVISNDNGKLNCKKLMTIHQGAQEEDVLFGLEQESDGTCRLIDLLPAFTDLAAPKTGKTYVIDELDRSFHTLLTRSLIAYFLDACDSTTRKQLIFTSHDALLINQHLLRRDEMWLTSRLPSGRGTLQSFADYSEARFDKDIRKSYLAGHMGGVPNTLY